MTNEDLLDPVDTTFVTDGNLALDTTATETEEDSHVEETADEEAPAVDASEEPQTDSESPAGDPATAELPPWTPSAKLLEKLGELISNRQKIEQVRNQKKATNAAYKEREDALDARIGELTEQINEETWHEVFDFENGIVVRTNRLTGEIETRPYEPPRQAEIPWVDDRLRAVVVGQYGEDPDGNHYVVEKVDRDSVLVRYYDDGTRWVGVSAWGDYAPRKDVDQAEYEQAFSEEQASWTNDVLEAIEEEGATAVQIEESMFFGGGEQLARVQLALDRLESSRAVRVADRDGERFYVLQDPDEEPIVTTQVIDHVTAQWEGIGEIAKRAGLDSKAASKLIKVEVEAGRVEAEGEKRGRKYRLRIEE